MKIVTGPFVVLFDTRSMRCVRSRGAHLISSDATALVLLFSRGVPVSSHLEGRGRIGSGMVRTDRHWGPIDGLARLLRRRRAQGEPVQHLGPPPPPSHTVRSVDTFLIGCPCHLPTPCPFANLIGASHAQGPCACDGPGADAGGAPPREREGHPMNSGARGSGGRK